MLTAFKQRVSRLLGIGTRPPTRPAPGHRAALSLEPLEERAVPVVGLTPLAPVLDNGVLSVIGDDNANRIVVTLSGGQLQVLGQSFNALAVQKIVIDGQGGDDFIQVSTAITLKTYLYGG